MCHFCTNVSRVSLFGQVSTTHLTVCKWSAKFKPTVEPLLLFWAGLYHSFSGSGTEKNENKLCYQRVHFIITEFHTQIFSEKWLTFIFLCTLNWQSRKCFDKERITKKTQL